MTICTFIQKKKKKEKIIKIKIKEKKEERKKEKDKEEKKKKNNKNKRCSDVFMYSFFLYQALIWTFESYLFGTFIFEDL